MYVALPTAPQQNVSDHLICIESVSCPDKHALPGTEALVHLSEVRQPRSLDSMLFHSEFSGLLVSDGQSVVRASDGVEGQQSGEQRVHARRVLSRLALGG
jgi:hypothetical protein